MSVNNTEVWELAEAWLNGTLSETDAEILTARRNADPMFDAAFMEAQNMMQALNDSGREKRFRSMLRTIHKEHTVRPVRRKARNIFLTPQFWRTAGVAAGVAIITSTITFWSLKPSLNKTESHYNTISREVTGLKIAQARQQARQHQLELNLDAKAKKNMAPTSDVKKAGTGFALSNNGYFATAYHVIHDENGYGDSVYIQNSEGQYFKANLVAFDAEADVAIMKVTKPGFKFGKGELPYTLSAGKAGLGTHIFTLGYPTDDIAYGEGYISSRNGFEGNNLQYTLELPVGHGQSGSPLIDGSGNVLGLLTAVGSQTEEKTYAVSARAITTLLHSVAEMKSVKLPRSAHIGRMSREQQISKMEAYTFAVKVYKK